MLTEIAAITGAVLGILNSAWQFTRTRTRLRVIPGFETYGEAFGDSHTDITIKVVNLSEFPVVIEEAGIQFVDGDVRPLNFRHTFKTGNDIESRSLPLTLAARDAVVLTTSEDNGIRASLTLSMYQAKCAYIRTASGYIKTGTSMLLKNRVAQARAESNAVKK